MSPMVSCETFSWDNTFNKNIFHLSNHNTHHANNSITLIHNLQRQAWGPDTILHHTLSVPCAAAEGSHVSSLLTPAARSLEVSENVDAESSKSWRQNFHWFNQPWDNHLRSLFPPWKQRQFMEVQNVTGLILVYKKCGSPVFWTNVVSFDITIIMV